MGRVIGTLACAAALFVMLGGILASCSLDVSCPDCTVQVDPTVEAPVTIPQPCIVLALTADAAVELCSPPDGGDHAE